MCIDCIYVSHFFFQLQTVKPHNFNIEMKKHVLVSKETYVVFLRQQHATGATFVRSMQKYVVTAKPSKEAIV